MALNDNDARPIKLSDTNDGADAFSERAAAKYDTSLGDAGYVEFLKRSGAAGEIDPPPPLTAAKVRRFSEAFQASSADPEIKRDIALAAESLIKNLPSIH